MADKKGNKDPLKGGVKFQDQQQPQLVQQKSPVSSAIKYKDAREQKDHSIRQFNKVQSYLKMFTAQDPNCIRKDTALALKHLLDILKETMGLLNIGTFEDKVQNYYLLYNATIFVFEICRILRKSVFQSVAIDYIAFALTSLEGNLQLISIKYLDWRIKLYMELANIYYSLGSNPCALRTIELALAKVQELREVEEIDLPLPDYIDKTLLQNSRNLRLLDLKFRLQSGMTVDLWKKKLEEYFGKDLETKTIAIIESLRLSPPNQSNTIKQTVILQCITLKDQILTASYEILKPDLDKIASGLDQQMDKIGKTVEFKQSLQQTFQNGQDEEQKRIDLTKQKRDYEATLLKEKDWRKSASQIPLEYHIELAHHAYDCGNIKVFEDITNSAMIRVRHRRIEVPFIVDVDIKVSNTPSINVPNGYQQIQVDLNEASLRLELKKLRNRAKQDGNKEEKKEEQKDKKQDDKKKMQQQEQKPLLDQVGYGVQASDDELSKINHTYVYLIYKTSPLPDNAIYQIDIVMGDENDGPLDKLLQDCRAIAIPIKQYTGVRETNKTIPHILLKHTSNALSDESQKLSLVTGLRPLFGKHPLIRPDMGFTKLNCDLRQTPRDFIRSHNMDYLFITFKQEKYFDVNERELQILVQFNQLEKSILKEKAITIDDDAKLELDIFYDLDKLRSLIKILQSCLIGPLGEYFLDQRKDFLSQLVFILWKKYFVSPLYQFEFIQELRITSEISSYDYQKYEKWIELGKAIFKEGLLVFNQILFKLQSTNIILLAKISNLISLYIFLQDLSLSKFLEEDKQYLIAGQNLRICVSRIEQYRNQQLSRGVETQKDLFLPFSLTCSNRKIKAMIHQMKEQYVKTKNQVNREQRTKQRGTKTLDNDEEDEEEFEVLESFQNHLGDDNRDLHYFMNLPNDVAPIDDVNLLINAVHADLLTNIYRQELKAGKESQKLISTNTQQEAIEGVSNTIIKKMSISKGPTAQNIKKNLTQLQTTLQKEGKIEAPKPLLHEYEKELIKQANKNNYANCLLYLVLATNKQKQTEQKSLLQKSLEYLKEAQDEEDQYIQHGIQDSIFVLSTLLDNLDSQQAAEQYFPFNKLYDPEFIKSTQVPRKPVLICRTSTSVTFKLPPYKPKLLHGIAIDQAKKSISSMAIFGKISANGVNVSLTCNDLPNTGTRQKIGGIVHISNCTSNAKYCFAVAGYDMNEAVSNGIGETSEDISMLHPLPLSLLASYLSKTAYQLSHFDIAEEAADFCTTQFTEDSDFIDRMLDNQQNPIYLKRIIQERLKEVGLIEISNLTETFLIKAKCMKRKLQNDNDQVTPAQQQKQYLKICNYLLLALETSLCSRNYPMLKRLVGELFNIIEQFLFLQQKPMQIFHLLLKAQIIIVEVPKQYWDANLRILSAKYTYEILRTCLQVNEITLGKRILYSQLKTFNKKWYQIPKLIMVEEQQQQIAANNVVKKDTKKDAKKPQQNDEPPPPVKMVPKLIRELYESPSSLQDFLEETLLSMNEEFGEYIPQFVEKWKEQIDQFAPYVENNQDQMDRALSDLSVRLEYWDCFRDINSAYTKVQNNFKTSPFYTEILCKLFRRMLETPGVDVKTINDNLMAITDLPTSEAVRVSIEIKDLQIACMSLDSEFYPDSLPYLQQERETNKSGNDETIEIFENYFKKQEYLNKLLQEEQIPQFGLGSLSLQAQRFDRIHIWQSEIHAIKGIVQYQVFKKDFRTIKEVQGDQFYNVYQLDLQRFKSLITEFEAADQTKQELKKIKDQSQLLQQQQQVATKPAAGKQQPTGGKQPVQVELLSEEDQKRSMLESVTKNISFACSHALNSQEYLQLINEVKFLINMINYEQVSPFELKGTQCWKYFALTSLCVIHMLIDVHKNGLNKIRQEREDVFRIQAHQQSLPQVKIQTTQSAQHEESPVLPILSTHLSKDFWFTNIKDLEMDLLANLIAYTTQTLMVEQKWKVLIGITREFCNLTTHYYSLFILPFTVHAQQILLSIAQPQRKSKESELAQREEAFEVWVQTKKKKTRSSVLTQEVLPEELQFQHDKQELERQITLLKQKEQFIQHELDISEKLIGEIQRDANQALEGLKQARKLYEKFAQDDREISTELTLYEFHNQEVAFKSFLSGNKQDIRNDNFLKQRAKNHKQFAMQIISRYKLAIEVLRKRQEKFALVLALKELGNINYSLNNLSQAEEMWSDSLDTIFQRIYTLKNSTYRKMILESQQPLAQTYGITQCLIGLNLCAQLGHFSYYANLHQQRESSLLASELVYSVFKMHLPNGMSWAGFIENNNCEFGEVSKKLFSDRFILDPAETALSCERISWMLMDREEPIKSLPLLILLKQIAYNLNSHFYTIRALLMKSISLSNIGCINEAYQLLVKVAGEKDLPLTLIGSRQSLWQSKTTGENWFTSTAWSNQIPPYDEKHFALTESILKELQLTKAFGMKYGPLNENLFNYAVASLIYNIHQGDVVEKWEINEQRSKILQKVETIIRSTLKKIGFEEELHYQIHLVRQEELYLRLQGEEPNLESKKEEIFQYAKANGNILDKTEFEQYYNLLANTNPVGNSNNEEALNYYQKREERLHLMVRLRLLLSKISVSLGLITRSLQILKNAIENISQYCLDQRKIEFGEESENIPIDQIKPQGMEENKKGGKAAPPPAKEKDDKKQAKGTKQVDNNKEEELKKKEEENLRKQQQQLLQFLASVAENRRTRQCINVFWWIRLRVELLQLLYRHNRVKEASDLIEILRNDVRIFNDSFYLRIITEYHGRLFVKQGKFDDAVKKFEEALGIAKQFQHNDVGLCVLNGDYGELLRERKHFEEAQQLFFDAYTISQQYLVQVNYGFGHIQNNNSRGIVDKIQISSELQISRDAEEELLRKGDRLNIKGGKKDDKKGKDDGKQAKKGPDKKQQKVQQSDKPDMKIVSLNPMPNLNLGVTQKLNYALLDSEIGNSTAHPHNCYIKQVEVWLRSSLRHVEATLLINPVVEDSLPSYDNDSPSESSDTVSNKSGLSNESYQQKTNIFSEKEIQDLLTTIENVINTSYNVPTSFRLELFYLQAKIHRRKFVKLLLNLQHTYFKKFLQEKNKKYKKFWEKRPFRDLIKNKYFLDIPGFSQEMKENGLTYLNQSKDILKKAINVIRGEAVLYEHFRKPEDVLVEMAEVCLLIREYRPRIGYKYVDVNNLQKLVNSKAEDVDLEQQFQKLEKSDRLDQLNLELEASSYLKYAIDLVKARNELCDLYHSVGQTQNFDVTKLPIEIFIEIIEQDYIYKKNYPTMLFDEMKKKTGVNAIDVLVFMQKTWREIRVMTFSGNYLQRYLSKAHRYLKLVVPNYQRCLLTSLEVAPKADLNAQFVEDGSLVIRNLYDRLKHEFKLIYVLGGLNKDKILTSIPKEEKDKILINDEKEVLYGNIYIQEGNLSILLQETLDLKQKMLESDQRSIKAKERDYKQHKKNFYKLIESIGTYFFQKSGDFQQGDTTKNINKKKEATFEQSEVQEIDLLDKYGVFVPDLTHENLELLINLFTDVGVQAVNHNYLVIFRFFHQNKYK